MSRLDEIAARHSMTIRYSEAGGERIARESFRDGALFVINLMLEHAYQIGANPPDSEFDCDVLIRAVKEELGVP